MFVECRWIMLTLTCVIRSMILVMVCVCARIHMCYSCTLPRSTSDFSAHVIASPRMKKPMVATKASPGTVERQNMLKKERNKQNHAVDSIAECEVRVGDQPDQQMLAREVRVRAVQTVSADLFVDTCLVWFLHLLLAEQLLLFTSYHGLHDLDWHLGPSLRTGFMLKNSRVNILYWLFGTVTLSALLFLLPAAFFLSSCDSFGREASFYIFSHRSGLFSVALLSNPGLVVSCILMLVFHLPCCSDFRASDTRAFLVFFPVTSVIGLYFAWYAFEAIRAKKGSDIAFLRYTLFPVDTVALCFLKAALFILTELLIILKLENIYVIPWIHVVSPILAMSGLVLMESVARSAWPCKWAEVQMRHQLDLVAGIDALCFGILATLIGFKLDNPETSWGKTIAVPIVALFAMHSLWLVVDFFRRVYSTPLPKPKYITWIEPVLTGLDMDEELQYFEVRQRQCAHEREKEL